ncbi:hypothetical protein ABBQ32_007661 [Trebouxia sp. C0010 RCD-2024]
MDANDAAILGFMADDAAVAAMAKLNPEAPVWLLPSTPRLFHCTDCASNVMLTVLNRMYLQLWEHFLADVDRQQSSNPSLSEATVANFSLLVSEGSAAARLQQA